MNTKRWMQGVVAVTLLSAAACQDGLLVEPRPIPQQVVLSADLTGDFPEISQANDVLAQADEAWVRVVEVEAGGPGDTLVVPIRRSNGVASVEITLPPASGEFPYFELFLEARVQGLPLFRGTGLVFPEESEETEVELDPVPLALVAPDSVILSGPGVPTEIPAWFVFATGDSVNINDFEVLPPDPIRQVSGSGAEIGNDGTLVAEGSGIFPVLTSWTPWHAQVPAFPGFVPDFYQAQTLAIVPPPANPCLPQPLAIGQTVQGDLLPPGENCEEFGDAGSAVFYTFTVAEDGFYRVQISSGAFLPAAVVATQTGPTELRFQGLTSGIGASGASEAVIQLRPGPYILGAFAADPGSNANSGRFSLTVEPTGPEMPANEACDAFTYWVDGTQPGYDYTGDIADGGCVLDVPGLEGPAWRERRGIALSSGQTLTVQVSSNNFFPMLALVNTNTGQVDVPFELPVAETDSLGGNGYIEYVAPADGIYILEFAGWPQVPGDYRFQIIDGFSPRPCTPRGDLFTDGASFTGVIDTDDCVFAVNRSYQHYYNVDPLLGTGQQGVIQVDFAFTDGTTPGNVGILDRFAPPLLQVKGFESRANPASFQLLSAPGQQPLQLFAGGPDSLSFGEYTVSVSRPGSQDNGGCGQFFLVPGVVNSPQRLEAGGDCPVDDVNLEGVVDIYRVKISAGTEYSIAVTGADFDPVLAYFRGDSLIEFIDEESGPDERDTGSLDFTGWVEIWVASATGSGLGNYTLTAVEGTALPTELPANTSGRFLEVRSGAEKACAPSETGEVWCGGDLGNDLSGGGGPRAVGRASRDRSGGTVLPLHEARLTAVVPY